MAIDAILNILRAITGRRFHGNPVRASSDPQLKITWSPDRRSVQKIELVVPSEEYGLDIPVVVAVWVKRMPYPGGCIWCQCDRCLDKSPAELWWHDLGWDCDREGRNILPPDDWIAKANADYPDWYSSVQRIYPELTESEDWIRLAPSHTDS